MMTKQRHMGTQTSTIELLRPLRQQLALRKHTYTTIRTTMWCLFNDSSQFQHDLVGSNIYVPDPHVAYECRATSLPRTVLGDKEGETDGDSLGR